LLKRRVERADAKARRGSMMETSVLFDAGEGEDEGA
jgi:hypothetical protein